MANQPLDRHYNKNNIITQIELTRDLAVKEAQAFVMARPFIPNPNFKAIALQTDAVLEGLSNLKYSTLGLPVWDIVQLQYADLSTDLSVFFNIATIVVSNSKNIIKTSVQGLDSSIKEYINTNDYSIQLNAVIVGDAPDSYPEVELSAIQKMFKINSAIDIYSSVVNRIYGFSKVVIEDIKISQSEPGMRNVQLVEMNLISDDPSVYKLILRG